MIKQHKAALLTCPEQLLDALHFRKKGTKKVIQKQLFVALTSKEKEVLACLAPGEKKHLDTIAAKVQKEVRFVASVLMTLEMKGCVNALPGKFFEVL